jgi:glycosyltransferase involved in cell wall biosynthesis
MVKDKIRVIHLDTGKTWRGGQQQAAYLHEGLLNRGYISLMLCPHGSALADYCNAKNLPFTPLDFAHELDYRSGWNAAKIAGIHSASVLQLHSGHSVSWGLWTKLFRSKLKLVATRRVDFSIRKNPFSDLKYSTRMLDHIVCISEKIRQVMISDGIPENKLSVIRSGIDLHRFDNIMTDDSFRQRWQIPSDSIIVGTVAAFTGHKDYPNFLKAASIAAKANPKLRFMAVGDGDLLPPIRKSESVQELGDKVIFTGFQSNVGSFLKAFDIFVLASKLEGLGTSVLDAMALGLPIVATQAGGIPEMILDGKDGLLVQPGDAQSLAEAILYLTDHPDIAQNLGNNAKLSVQAFDINQTVETYIDLYSRLVNA